MTTPTHAPQAAARRPVLGRAGVARIVGEWARDPGGLAVGALVLIAAGFIALQLGGFWGGDDTRTLISDVAFLPVSIIAAILAIRASRHEALDERTRRAWMIVGISFVFYWLGDVVWTIEENVGSAPYPSVADFLYLAFYPTCMWGILAFPTAPRTSNDKLKLWLDTGTVVLASFMMLFYWVIGPTLRETDAGTFATAVSIAYPTGDLVLIFAITRILLGQPPRGTGHALGILATGLGLFVVADVAFANLALRDQYQGGDWPDSFWMVAQVMTALSAQYQYWRATHARDQGMDLPVPVRPFSPLPYLVIFGSFILMAAVGWNEAPYPLGGLMLGAVGVIALVVTRQVMSLRENLRLVEELHVLASIDSLTGLLGRRHFFERAEREFSLASRYCRPLAAMMIDVDHFKQINDTFGHAAGDTVLQSVSHRVRDTLRAGDLIGRYGGDEMVVLLPETDLPAALLTAERLHAAIGNGDVDTPRGPVPIAISVGVAPSAGCSDLGQLLHQADQALYEAKQAGRRTTRVSALPAGA